MPETPFDCRHCGGSIKKELIPHDGKVNCEFCGQLNDFGPQEHVSAPETAKSCFIELVSRLFVAFSLLGFLCLELLKWFLFHDVAWLMIGITLFSFILVPISLFVGIKSGILAETKEAEQMMPLSLCYTWHQFFYLILGINVWVSVVLALVSLFVLVAALRTYLFYRDRK